MILIKSFSDSKVWTVERGRFLETFLELLAAIIPPSVPWAATLPVKVVHIQQIFFLATVS